MGPVERRYLSVDGRRVHYRRMGSGPPLVLLHASPANSEMVLEEMAAAAPYFTCFAFDTPAFGESEPLSVATIDLGALAGATAAAMRALGLPACPVFGTHSGAAIALALAVGWEDQVTGLVLEGVPVLDEAECGLLANDDYMPVSQIDPLGGHLTSAWIRFRDQFTWFPWLSRNVTRLNAVDRPTPAEIHHWVSMYWRTYRTYADTYKAVLRYGGGQLIAAQALQQPAVFMASEEDMLYPHLDRLPPLKPHQRIERLPYDPPAKLKRIVQWLRDLPQASAPPPASPKTLVGRDPAVQMVDIAASQVFVRVYGDLGSPAVIVLHDAPGTGLAVEAEARALAATGVRVVVPDLPGTGDSSPPPSDQSVLKASVEAVSSIIEALALDRVLVAGIGCGATVAVLFAARRDSRLSTVIVEDLPAADEATALAVAPDLPLSPEGAHWIKAWLMIRDNQIYKPWFDGRVAAQRKTQGNFDAVWLHDQTVALMKSRASYHRLPREAWREDVAAQLGAITAPLQIASAGELFSVIRSSLNRNGPVT